MARILETRCYRRAVDPNRRGIIHADDHGHGAGRALSPKGVGGEKQESRQHKRQGDENFFYLRFQVETFRLYIKSI
jgi:hypothetical protein